jgi:DME family drug/metabolite transporter
MNGLFVSAMARGPAANAILLQYTAPMWLYLASVWLLREPADRRSSVALVIGLLGIGIIVGGGWNEGQLPVVGIALGSGVAYAGVLICLRVLRGASPRWLTVINHLFGALALVPFLWYQASPSPRPQQIAFLILFGAVQMALPYWLVSRGLRVVSPQEAGIITLLEPLLNPLWAFLVVGELPPPATFAGGAFILGALVWRYWPRNRGQGSGVRGQQEGG